MAKIETSRTQHAGVWQLTRRVVRDRRPVPDDESSGMAGNSSEVFTPPSAATIRRWLARRIARCTVDLAAIG